MLKFFRKKKKPERKSTIKPTRSKDFAELKEMIKRLSTKNDVKAVVSEVISSRKAIINEISSVPDDKILSELMTKQITKPLQNYISELSSNQAVKQQEVKQLSSNQAGLDGVVAGMKQKLDMLTPRHLKVLSVLVKNRSDWLCYEDIGNLCNPQLSDSCIRGYVADLINMYKIPIEKKSFGRQNRVHISDSTFKQLAITRLID